MKTNLKRSKKMYRSASRHLVGGVNSPVRSFKSVDGNMIFAKKAKGPYIWDIDKNKYIDYIMSWGVSVLGHAPRQVVKAAVDSIVNGSSFGLTSENEIKLACLIKEHFKSIDKIRFVSSGTEACMSAVRLARAYTGKRKILKFDGCYHGHFDSLLVKAGSGNLTFGIPSGEGILDTYTKDTISIPFNDKRLLEQAVRKNKNDIACVIIEPVPCNTGVILPRDDFLKRVREITSRNKILLIFDEVITGFRLSLGGAQKLFGIKPDITCLGKIIGGGFPVGAFGGSQEIMGLLAPEGPVYQAGTLSGNPVAVVSGIKMIEELRKDPAIYKKLEQKTNHLVSLMNKSLRKRNISAQINSTGSIFSVFFTNGPIKDHKDTLASDKKKYATLFRSLIDQKVLFPPSPFEACFLSVKHGELDIERTASAFDRALSQISGM